MVKVFNSLEEATQKVPLGKSILLDAPNNVKICLVHTKEGFFAVQNQCSHSGADLYKGFINEQNEVVCPLHHYCFDLRTGRSTRGSASNLKVYRLEWRKNEDSSTEGESSLYIEL